MEMQPANGGDVCGKWHNHDYETLKKNLSWTGQNWLCAECLEDEQEQDQESELMDSTLSD